MKLSVEVKPNSVGVGVAQLGDHIKAKVINSI